MIRIAAIGAGNRTGKYLAWVTAHPERTVLTALVEPDALRREAARRKYGLSPAQCYASAEAFFAAPREADALIIGSPDAAHFAQAVRAMEEGYPILLEKPVALTPEECRRLLQVRRETGVAALGCLVLRYHPFYQKAKALLEEGAVGTLVSVSHRIQIGLDRMTHSYVRGPWGSERETSSIFLNKCCHDVDLLLWLTGAKVVRVQSEGGLRWFRPENAPAGSTDRCIHCSVEADCPYSAVDLYRRRQGWTDNFVGSPGTPRETLIEQELRSGRYGRCVYRCGNDVADHQSVLLQAADGMTLTIEMDAFSRRDGRRTVVSGSEGELIAEENRLILRRFRPDSEEIFDFTEVFAQPFHGGADFALVEDFVQAIEHPQHQPVAPLEDTIEGHLICLRA